MGGLLKEGPPHLASAIVWQQGVNRLLSQADDTMDREKSEESKESA